MPVIHGSLGYPTSTLGEQLVTYISPSYLKVVPFSDGWNSWYLYGTTTEKTDYAVRSAGKESDPQTTPLYGPTTDFTDDIILVNGQFVQWPEGIQR